MPCHCLLVLHFQSSIAPYTICTKRATSSTACQYNETSVLAGPGYGQPLWSVMCGPLDGDPPFAITELDAVTMKRRFLTPIYLCPDMSTTGFHRYSPFFFRLCVLKQYRKSLKASGYFFCERFCKERAFLILIVYGIFDAQCVINSDLRLYKSY